MIEIPVDEVMKHDVRKISPNTTLAAAAKDLYGYEMGSLIVVDEDDPLGIITKSDVNMVVAQGRTPNEVTVEESMSEPLITIDRTASIRSAANLMSDHSIKKLPVTDEKGELVGIIAAVDLMCYLPTYREKIHSHKPEPKSVSDTQ